MSTNPNTPMPAASGITGEGWAAIAARSAQPSCWRRSSSVPGPRSRIMSRADFYAEMLDLRERLNSNHLALLEKLQAEPPGSCLLPLGGKRLGSADLKPGLHGWTSARSYEARKPKSEDRSKAETRHPRRTMRSSAGWRSRGFAIRPSDFLRPSAFGFRIWSHMAEELLPKNGNAVECVPTRTDFGVRNRLAWGGLPLVGHARHVVNNATKGND